MEKRLSHDGQLRSRRDDVGDTAPASEGCREVWVPRRLQRVLSRAMIMDWHRRSLMVPTSHYHVVHVGGCGDLGNRDQLPVYCFAPPSNMMTAKGDTVSGYPRATSSSGYACQLCVRLSTGKDIKLVVRAQT